MRNDWIDEGGPLPSPAYFFARRLLLDVPPPSASRSSLPITSHRYIYPTNTAATIASIALSPSPQRPKNRILHSCRALDGSGGVACAVGHTILKLKCRFCAQRENVNNNYRYGYFVEITTGVRGAVYGWVIRTSDASMARFFLLFSFFFCFPVVYTKNHGRNLN